MAQVAEEACSKDEAVASEASRVAGAIKDDCQRDLDQALPEYEAAIKALDNLDKKDIQEVKSFANPPALVNTVMQAVCLLMNRKQSWDEAKKLLNEANFMQQLKEYDKDSITNKLLKQLQDKFTSLEDFNPKRVRRDTRERLNGSWPHGCCLKVEAVSKAATSICMWVRAMDTYARVAR